MTMPAQKPGRSRQDYGTPPSFIRAVEARFGPIEWDLAAHAENTKCGPHYYGPGSAHGENSLAIGWAARHPTGTLWLNPPFADITPWAKKCAEESQRRHGLIVMLTPASIGTDWFAEHVNRKAIILGLAPRLTFEGTSDPYPKDLMASVFGHGLSGFDTWRWDEGQIRPGGQG